jgi:alpha-D-ribose 1-methylphosphonate 5-triphosphate synthase subunit PhnL
MFPFFICCCVQAVYGNAEPGDMLALMGPSGAGKSTLMDILAGRKSVGNLTGSVMVNGMPRKKDDFARKTAYVPQVRGGCMGWCVLLVMLSLCGLWHISLYPLMMCIVSTAHRSSCCLTATHQGSCSPYVIRL